MSSFSDWQTLFDQHGICVLIPTYNNGGTLDRVITEVLGFTSNVFVVNDGSTDATAELLQQFPGITVLAYTPNRGKGWALRKGFRLAADAGYRYAIAIDSDGQHFAKDLPMFVNDLIANGDGLVMGARNMDQASVPGKSSVGNKISSFWFNVETGVKLTDTQSGYRLYPIHSLSKMKWITRKFEFEIEVLVRASWSGIPVRSVPVTVYYPPHGTRISHFRPFKDFTRITILNVIFVFIAFLWIKPRDFFRMLFQKKKLKEAIRKQLFNTGQSDELKSVSIAFGVFMGIIPIWGFQLVVAIFLAVVLRLNKALVIIAANISIPPMIPFIIFLSHWMGAWWMGDRETKIRFDRTINLDTIKANLEQYIYGSITLAIIAALLAGIVAWCVLKFSKNRTAAKLTR